MIKYGKIKADVHLEDTTMNIQFQICGLCILFLLIIFYKSHKTLKLYKEKVFYGVMCTMTVSLAGDILSLVMIRYREFLSPILVDAICKFYIITLIWVSCSALVYVLSDLVSEQRHRNIAIRMVGVQLVQSIIIFLLPIYIFVDGKQMYTYGPAV